MACVACAARLLVDQVVWRRVHRRQRHATRRGLTDGRGVNAQRANVNRHRGAPRWLRWRQRRHRPSLQRRCKRCRRRDVRCRALVAETGPFRVGYTRVGHGGVCHGGVCHGGVVDAAPFRIAWRRPVEDLIEDHNRVVKVHAGNLRAERERLAPFLRRAPHLLPEMVHVQLVDEALGGFDEGAVAPQPAAVLRPVGGVRIFSGNNTQSCGNHVVIIWSSRGTCGQ